MDNRPPTPELAHTQAPESQPAPRSREQLLADIALRTEERAKLNVFREKALAAKQAWLAEHQETSEVAVGELDVQSLESIQAFAKKTELESKESYEASIDKAIEALRGESGLVELKKTLPTVIIPDLHGRREFLAAALAEKQADGKTLLEHLKAGTMTLICLGDGMHSENSAAWVPSVKARQEGNTDFVARWDAYRKTVEEVAQRRKPDESSPRPIAQDYQDPAVVAAWQTVAVEHDQYERKLMHEEMIRSLGLMKLVMELKATYPEQFHYIRGNHDFIDGGFYKYANESEEFREAIEGQFGEEFVDDYAAFEQALPLMVKHDRVVASHTIPPEPIEKPGIASRDPIISGKDRDASGHHRGLTWTDNTRMSFAEVKAAVDGTLGSVGATPEATWFIGHRPVYDHVNGGRYRTGAEGRLVQINNPEKWVRAIVPTSEEFDPAKHIAELTE